MTIRVAPGITITQSASYKPIFDVVNVDFVTIDAVGALLTCTGDVSTYGNGASRSDDVAMYSATVWSNGSSGSKGSFDVNASGNCTCGVYLSGARSDLTQHTSASKVRNRVRVKSDGQQFAPASCARLTLPSTRSSRSTRSWPGGQSGRRAAPRYLCVRQPKPAVPACDRHIRGERGQLHFERVSVQVHRWARDRRPHRRPGAGHPQHR